MGLLDFPTWACARDARPDSPTRGRDVWQRVIVIFYRRAGKRRFRAELEFDASAFADASGPEAAIGDLMRKLSPA